MRPTRTAKELEWQFAVESRLRSHDRRWQVASTNTRDSDWCRIFPCRHDAGSGTRQYRELAAALIWDEGTHRIGCSVCEGNAFIYPAELADYWLKVLGRKN